MEGIFEIRTFVKLEEVSKSVKTVRQFIDNSDNTKIKYQGFSVIGINANGRTIPQELEWEIETDSVEKAFEVFDEGRKKAAEDFVKMIEAARIAQQKQIIVPGK